MRKQFLSLAVTLGMSIAFLLNVNHCVTPSAVVYAAEEKAEGIRIDEEYLVPDIYGWCTYYILVATNETGEDIAISSDFVAIDGNGNVLSKAHDYLDAVRNGQQFILYGQFLNEDLNGVADYDYSFDIRTTDKCSYSMISVDASRNDRYLEVSATNYSESDIQGVGVRTVFMKNGRAVGFDAVNIADYGYTFYGGSTNSQILGYNTKDYDNYILTYASARN